MKATIRSMVMVGAMALSVPLWAAEPVPATDFGKLDRNGDGKISLAEAKGNANLEVNFESLDRNRDGFLSLEEFGRTSVPADPSTAPGGSAGAQHMPKR